ncbi:hypothetical protein PAHAL_8G187400 [Panicum hallii]|uniref:Uncharacterized protein n=1 Tax=Panicum hallii TaxID=206008 RepID=A0A2T8I9F4_9POAL|nr:hypothetical protein PAHAL_8G187400 [Panicum hallii]
MRARRSSLLRDGSPPLMVSSSVLLAAKVTLPWMRIRVVRVVHSFPHIIAASHTGRLRPAGPVQ